MLIFLIILLLYILIVCMYNSKTTLRRCYSFTCQKNVKGRCLLKEIDMYDNGVMGICLWHSEDMTKRILNPINQGKKIGKIDSDLELVDKLVKWQEDAKAIKDPKEFTNWLKKHGIGG